MTRFSFTLLLVQIQKHIANLRKSFSEDWKYMRQWCSIWGKKVWIWSNSTFL